jgi:transcriptional regulator with XRE-family HTH domain
MATLPLTTDTLGEVPSVETIDPDARRRELASFLRSRRERVQPQDVGLPPGIRRRTPGLRREEVAQLSGVGVTWYTWLEQGRDINVSTQVVDAIARTLKLDRYEWAHLSTLAGIATGPQPQQCAALPAAVRKVMHQVAPYPAAVLNDRFDLLAYNPEYRELIFDLDALPAIEHNLLWLAFTNPDWRAAMIDAEQSRCRLVGTFRSNMAKHLGEPGWQDLLTRLCAASPEFAERWERHEVAPMGQRLKVIDSPKVGLLRLESTSLWVSQGGSVRLLVYTPVDDESAAKLPGLSPA